jgi:hypothetical protein
VLVQALQLVLVLVQALQLDLHLKLYRRILHY